MEMPMMERSSWPFFLASPFLYPMCIAPENYVHWTETPESHLFSAGLPGVRKEDIRVELEDSIYLIIRTECGADATEPTRSFMRKFRLPERVNLDGICAGYEDGVLTVTVPRLFVRGRPRIDPAILPDRNDGLLARAA